MRSAGKNFFFLSSAEIVSKIFGFLTTAYLARKVGVDGFGDYGFVLAVYAYFALLANPGYDIIGARETARSDDEHPGILSSFFLLKSGSAVISFVLLLLVCLFVPFSSAVRQLLLLQGLVLFTVPFTFQFYFRAHNQMHIVAVSRFAQSTLYFLFVIAGVQNAADLPQVPVFFAVASALAIIPMAGILWKSIFGIHAMQWERLRAYAVSAVTVGAASMCIQVYLNIDTVMLGFFKTSHEVGLYTSAYKIVTLASAVPNLLFASYLPYLVSLKSTGTWQWKKFALTMLIIGLPTGIMTGIYAPELVTILYGSAYDGAVLPLRILSINITAVFMSIAFAQPLLLLGKEKKYLSIVAWSAGFNLLLNVFLIPLYGMTGAALATVFAETLVAVRSWRALRLEVPLNFTKEVLSILGITAIALLAMGLCIFIFLHSLSISGIAFIAAYGILMTRWYMHREGMNEV
jgi:O-antigen/teichoic acid export membrane protein